MRAAISDCFSSIIRTTRSWAAPQFVPAQIGISEVIWSQLSPILRARAMKSSRAASSSP